MNNNRAPVVIGMLPQEWAPDGNGDIIMEPAKRIAEQITDSGPVRVVLAAPYPFLKDLDDIAGWQISLAKPIDMHPMEGPFSGTLGEMIDSYANYVIIGQHEERQKPRHGDEVFNLLLRQALLSKAAPVLCVGDRPGHRNPVQDSSEFAVRTQLDEMLRDVGKLPDRTVIVYDPVGDVSFERANAMAAAIRNELYLMRGKLVAERIPILMGGPVTYDNIVRFIHQPEIDGVLLRGYSVTMSDKFSRCVSIVKTHYRPITAAERP